MDRSRRVFLGSVPGIVSGCATLDTPSDARTTERPDSDGDGVPDGADDYPNDDRRATRTFRAEGSFTLRPGEFGGAVALTNSPEEGGDFVHYSVEVAGDTAIDCLVFEREAWDAYAHGARDVDVVSEYSRLGVTDAEETVQLGTGEYLYAVDYTRLGTDPGGEPVEVGHLLEIAEPR